MTAAADKQPKQYEDIMARVTVQDARLVMMEVRSSDAFWDVRANMAMPSDLDDEALVAWLYGQFDQVLAELRRLVRRGQFYRANESGAGN